MLIDAHAHVSSSKLSKKLPELLESFKTNRVGKVVDSAISISNSKECLKLAKKYPDVFRATLGIHPELLVPGSDIFSRDFTEKDISISIKKLEALYSEGKNIFVAIGECGLDFYWLDKNESIPVREKDSIKSRQELLFKEQIKLAIKLKLPIVIHSRGAEEQALGLIKATSDSVLSTPKDKRIAVLFHSFTGSLETAKQILAAGYYISFNGILTYPKATNVHEIFKFAWEKFPSLILSETDCPLLAPQIKRGQLSDPSDVRYVVSEMAKIASAELSRVETQIYRNTKEFYKL